MILAMSAIDRRARGVWMLAACLLAGGAARSTFAADSVRAATEERNVAVVKVELKQESGKVFKHDGAVFDWGSDGNIVFTIGDHSHDVALRVDRAGDDGKKIKLTVGYTRDGKPVIAPYTIDSQVKKREVVHVEGGIALAFTVTPKMVKVDENGDAPSEDPDAGGDGGGGDGGGGETEKPKDKPKNKIGGSGDTNDPLEGLK